MSVSSRYYIIIIIIVVIIIIVIVVVVHRLCLLYVTTFYILVPVTYTRAGNTRTYLFIIDDLTFALLIVSTLESYLTEEYCFLDNMRT